MINSSTLTLEGPASRIIFVTPNGEVILIGPAAVLRLAGPHAVPAEDADQVSSKGRTGLQGHKLEGGQLLLAWLHDDSAVWRRAMGSVVIVATTGFAFWAGAQALGLTMSRWSAWLIAGTAATTLGAKGLRLLRRKASIEPGPTSV